MWVRSQDKKVLIICNDFRIVKGECLLKGKFIIINNNITLGVYSTEEKALKVLDKISHYVVHHPLACYQMPQDSEV